MDQQIRLIRVLVVFCGFIISEGLLTDVSESSRVVVCSGNGFFNTVIPVLSRNNELAGVGLACSSGFIKIEGLGLKRADENQPYFFGESKTSSIIDGRIIQSTGVCDDKSAISSLDFQFLNDTQYNKDAVTSLQLTCTSLQNTSKSTTTPLINSTLISNTSTYTPDSIVSAQIGCQDGEIVDGFQIQWRTIPRKQLISFDAINCRQVKQGEEEQCVSPSHRADISCQGVANDCCSKLLDYDDVYECAIAGSHLKAWYTEFELNNFEEAKICDSQDEVTIGWFQIRSQSGVCMDATTRVEAQFSQCTSNHSQWFRFIGDGEYRKLESGEHVDKCLQFQRVPMDESSSGGQVVLQVFSLTPCQLSTTMWKQSQVGLQANVSRIGPVGRSALGQQFENEEIVIITELFNHTSVMVKTQDEVQSDLSQIARQLQRSTVQDTSNPQIPSPIIPASPQQIQLTPIQSVDNWSEELMNLYNASFEVVQDRQLTKQLLGIPQSVQLSSFPHTLTHQQFLQGPSYCNQEAQTQNNSSISIACDNWGRVIALKFHTKLGNRTAAREKTISSSIFDLPKLRNLDMAGLDLTGPLPRISNNYKNNNEDRVIRQILLNNNNLAGVGSLGVESQQKRVENECKLDFVDWSCLESVIYLDLQNNPELEVIDSWFGSRAFGVVTQVGMDASQCSYNNLTCYTHNNVLINRFTCLQSECNQNDVSHNNSAQNHPHIAVIIGTITAVLVFLLIIIFILFAFVTRRYKNPDPLTIETELTEGLKYSDPEKGGKFTPSPHKMPHLSSRTSDEPSLLERYLHDEQIVTWNTPPQYVVDWEIDYERDLKPKGTLGVGAMGTVQLAEWTNRASGDKQYVAVKVFSRYLQPIYKDAVEVLNQKLILREVEILMRVQHPNIVKCLGAILKPPHMGLVLEYMDVGNLDKYLHNICAAHPINDRDKLIIMKQIARSLDHLHPSVVHRDLKPQNILINTKGEVKLSDFGLSKIRQLQDAGRASSLQVIGTAPYTSPEVFRSNGLNVDDEKVDIYSLGIIMWEIWTLQRPWEGENMVAISYKVVNEEQRPPMPDVIHPRLRDLILSCWDDDPQRRPSARDIQRMLEWMIEEINTAQGPQKHQEISEQQSSDSLDNNSCEDIHKADSADHINVPADENHECVNITFIYSNGDTCEADYDWRDALLLLTDEINDYLGYVPDGDTSRFRLHRVVEIQDEEPQVIEIDLKNISDTLQQHGFYTRNKIYVELINQHD